MAMATLQLERNLSTYRDDGPIEHLVQTQRVYHMACTLISLYISVFEEEGWRRNGNCSQFCSCESLTFQQLSTPSDFLRLNLEEFREENRVEHLAPNQVPSLIETY